MGKNNVSARALLKNSLILVLDEATSSLDLQAELQIQMSLKSFANTKTILIVTHKLSTITASNEIIVLKNGYLVEQGKHEELLQKQGEYYTLYTTNYFENEKYDKLL